MGDHIGRFENEEIIFVGPNLPHFWRDEDHCDLSRAKAYVIHFTGDFLGKGYWETPELNPVKQLLQRSLTGLHFFGDTATHIAAEIRTMACRTGFQRLMQLQSLLFSLALSDEYESLSSPSFSQSFPGSRNERIAKVYEFVMYNFKNKISLEEVASVASMSKEGFCRYFRKSTGKTFLEFLNVIRIGYACRLLLQGDYNVIQICYESGFNNLSHFNRQFREITQESPQRYRDIFKRST